METLEIHKKDFLVKWVHAPDNSIIDWQIKPLKKSINFAIYRKNDVGNSPSSDPTASYLELPFQSQALLQNDENLPTTPPRVRSSSVASVNTITEAFKRDKLSRSNSISSNLSKSDMTLVKDYFKLISDELVHGKYQVTKGGMFAFIFDNSFSKTTGKKVLFSTKILLPSPEMAASGPQHTWRRVPNAFSLGGDNKNVLFNVGGSVTNLNSLSAQSSGANILRPKNGELMLSVLLKRRRKKLQGFTKRFFILNFKYGTLSYFRVNDNKLRGQMPIKQSIVSANAKTREIIVDSGMEIWDLKAQNVTDFNAWVDAFNEVKKLGYRGDPLPAGNSTDGTQLAVAGDLDALLRKIQRLKADTASVSRNAIISALSGIETDLEEAQARLRPVSAPPMVTTPSDALSLFSGNEFYDAQEYIDETNHGVVLLQDGSLLRKAPVLVDEENNDEDEDDDDASLFSSEDEEPVELQQDKGHIVKSDVGDDCDTTLFPLPLEPIVRDNDIPVALHDPPSILGFVRKNVGKDLLSIAMPVDMNEPVTFLQKFAEIIEYCDLIDNALQAPAVEESGERILRIAAFAVTYLSSMRKKERSSRKPFNPLLGETFELVREDMGIRLISEKVCHKPGVFALFVESRDWNLAYNPYPSQKFWGKSAEITTKGSVVLTINTTGEVFTWSQPTSLLKNIIAGEKYLEPASSMTIKSSNGQRAVVEFAKSGMFSGRLEDLTIKPYGADKKPLAYSVSGKWTESLTLKTNTTEKLIWTAGDLLPNSEKKFGLTSFAGSLNKITLVEHGLLPPTDSRLRPDMQVYIDGNLDEAERLKCQLEEDQRTRRKQMQEAGEEHQPRFFHHVGGEEGMPETGLWVYTKGPKSYWNRRKNGDWDDLPKMW